MRVANYHISGEIGSPDLIHWLSEEIGLYGSAEAARIVLHINSPGGDLLTALQAVNLIRSSPVPVLTIVNGSAESAALLVLMAGHKRAAFKNSFGMAHHLSTAMEGNYHSLRSSITQLELLHQTMVDMWTEFTKLDVDIINTKMLSMHDTFLSSHELLKYNIVDEILVPGPGLHSFIHGGVDEKKSKKAKK